MTIIVVIRMSSKKSKLPWTRSVSLVQPVTCWSALPSPRRRLAGHRKWMKGTALECGGSPF